MQFLIHINPGPRHYIFTFQMCIGAKDFDDFMYLAEQSRDIVNEGMYVYSTSVAILHRDDCRGVTVPPIQEIFPDRFVPAETINQAIKSDIRRTDDVSLFSSSAFFKNP